MMIKLLHKITVLVADDAQLNLMIMTHLLSETGASILTASNGRQVLETLEEQSVDIILMDLQMPVLDGYETTEIIRNCGQQYHNVPIIAVTAETAPHQIAKSTAVGMNDYLVKPFVPGVICEKILKCLHVPPPTQPDNSTESISETPLDFDLTYLNEITNGETDKLMMIVDNMLENAPLLLQQSREAVRLQHWAEAAGHLHKLKGLTGLFFMHSITEALSLAEKEAATRMPETIVISRQIDFVALQMPAFLNLIFDNLKK